MCPPWIVAHASEFGITDSHLEKGKDKVNKEMGLLQYLQIRVLIVRVSGIEIGSVVIPRVLRSGVMG